MTIDITVNIAATAPASKKDAIHPPAAPWARIGTTAVTLRCPLARAGR
jgi:hypothetical protein